MTTVFQTGCDNDAELLSEVPIGIFKNGLTKVDHRMDKMNKRKRKNGRRGSFQRVHPRSFRSLTLKERSMRRFSGQRSEKSSQSCFF
jgi:hypothetical protein